MLAVFGGEIEPLIPLYAVGVFTAFTLSQCGMVVRWRRLREPGWQRGLAINLVGAVATGVVAVVVGDHQVHATAPGSSIVADPAADPDVPGDPPALRARAAGELATQTPLDPDEIKHTVIVPIAAVNRVARQTLAYARSISDNVTAVHVTDDEAEIERMRQEWSELGTDVPLVIIESPYRALVGPLLAYIDEIDQQRPDDTLTVVLPEFIARHWWEHCCTTRRRCGSRRRCSSGPARWSPASPTTWNAKPARRRRPGGARRQGAITWSWRNE